MVPPDFSCRQFFVASAAETGGESTCDYLPGRGQTTTQPTATISRDAGATFYFTTDGFTPTLSSTVYASPFSISNPATLKAIAYISPNSSTITSAYVQFYSELRPISRTKLQWYKSDFGRIISSGLSIGRWIDMSNSGNDCTQGTTANQPTLVSNAINGCQ